MNLTTMQIIVNKQLLVKTFLSSRLKTVLPIQTLSLLKRASETEFVLALKTIAWERMKCTVQLICGLKIRQIYLWALTTHSWSTRKIVVICRGANQWTALKALVKSLRSRQATRIAANSAPSSDITLFYSQLVDVNQKDGSKIWIQTFFKEPLITEW